MVDITLPHYNKRLEIKLLTYPDETGQKRSKKFRSKQVTKVMVTTTRIDDSIVFLQQKTTPTNHVGVFVDKATHSAENRLLFFPSLKHLLGCVIDFLRPFRTIAAAP